MKDQAEMIRDHFTKQKRALNGTTQPDLKSVKGKKGGSVKLECKLENNEVVNLIRRSKIILHCQNEEYEISVKIGEELKLDILSNAEVVEHQDKTSKEWIKVWSRYKGVQSDRMNDTDGNLTIISFTSNDTGIYSILESDGQPLITVTVTVSSTELKGKQDKTHEDKTHNQIPVWVWILILIGVFLVALGALIALVVIKKRKRLTMNGNNEQDYTPGVQM
ncbi:hypothetical protein ROHU_001323 [Labeo rohita]|uniref:Uncharacterized protein n=1 Tax=Labeo rohita TaxID=84645 RepID=A0A498P2C8_LABRO|nr:hypothetical protein ROHU_001323 [Labeo rohita]